MAIASKRFCDICKRPSNCDVMFKHIGNAISVAIIYFFLDAIFVCAFVIIRAISFFRNFNSHIVQNYLQMVSIMKQVFLTA